jgi:hypothetical protein
MATVTGLDLHRDVRAKVRSAILNQYEKYHDSEIRFEVREIVAAMTEAAMFEVRNAIGLAEDRAYERGLRAGRIVEREDWEDARLQFTD